MCNRMSIGIVFASCVMISSALLWTQASKAAEVPNNSPAASGWQSIGMSGGGAMFTPAISPANPKLRMLNCDMSAAYVSRDGGANWQMIHWSQLHTNTRCKPAFHPTDQNVIFASDGVIKISRDQGEHWTAIPNSPRGAMGEIAIDQGQPNRMICGTQEGVWVSNDGGTTWTKGTGTSGRYLSFHFDQTSPAQARIVFAATDAGIFRSDDGGKTWAPKSTGLPGKNLIAFAGASNATSKQVVLYASLPTKAQGDKLAGGIFRSTDRGESWESAMGEGINRDLKAADEWSMGQTAQYTCMAAANANPNIVWAFNTNTGVQPPHNATIYRSEDAGKSWKPTFYADPRYKPAPNIDDFYSVVGNKQFLQEPCLGMAVAASDPNQLMTTDNSYCFMTDNGGTSWKPAHTRKASAGDANAPIAWEGTGLVVTSTWNYYIDPNDSNRHYICYTDIGFARSLDAGKTWIWWDVDTRAPWHNTTFALAFDPLVPGKIWGAFSNVHDIPNGNIVLGRHNANGPGGVCVSTDYGASWKVSNQGLPEKACTSVVMDPTSPAGNRTLYCSIFAQGVFKSTDDGKNWTKASSGLGSQTNMRVHRIERTPDGTLYAMITGLRVNGTFSPDGVGLYRSKDAAQSWQKVNTTQQWLWPKDFTVDDANPNTIYVGACDTPGKDQGGLWRSTDAGATWTRIGKEGPETFGAYLNPKKPGWIYMTLCEGAPNGGLWLSKDNGKTFAPMAGLPFRNAQRVTFDPKDDSIVYVTTFGGSVWRGPSDTH